MKPSLHLIEFFHYLCTRIASRAVGHRPPSYFILHFEVSPKKN
ncbi:hypothetical protein HMPREF2141_00631 [Bacteroides uniformis]|uniref:Uncharacterized protein n=1 Tax=Bacteroides uniformis (strain ATCC 8492 / DSM 6597 / CCUG 4942 / CIP 103695 / JCM 5828 / KCTC 5204 / NCTC 13054 / VPI 0061) TaxID=411479 RepID=A0ABC9ND03_BACUC|nr:hypothetical protein BACUNI_01620 [Bacteroides uniformis ATCC 8492]KXT38516.1 hypothetical protein HMPREF2141_00631 [Bacteroides uniformis]